MAARRHPPGAGAHEPGRVGGEPRRPRRQSSRSARPGPRACPGTEDAVTTTDRYDWDAIVNGLNQDLRLRSIPIGMKLFETVEEMEAIPKIRRPKAKHTTDQIVAQARQLGWTVGITMADLVGAQCGAVLGLSPQDDEWLSGKRMGGGWCWPPPGVPRAGPAGPGPHAPGGTAAPPPPPAAPGRTRGRGAGCATRAGRPGGGAVGGQGPYGHPHERGELPPQVGPLAR